MSIRTNAMKAVPVLLKNVRRARSIFLQKARDESLDAKLEKLTWELNKIKNLFTRVKKNEEELLDTLTEVNGHLRKLDKKRLHEEMDGICKRIRDSAHKLLPMDASASEAETEEIDTSQDHKSEKLHSMGITKPFDSYEDHKSEKVRSDPSSSHHKNELLGYQHLNLIRESYRKLGYRPNICLLSLLVFPEDAVIKKRHTIYWWIGGGIVRNTSEKTEEEVGEVVIHDLLKYNMIVPYSKGKCPVMNKFKINPHIRPELVSSDSVSRKNQQHLGFLFQLHSYDKQHVCLVLEQQKVTLGDGEPLTLDRKLKNVFNVGASVLNFGSQWLAKTKNLEVLQLGRWQDLPSHHIEVGSERILKGLRDKKKLKYLSLRGISGISELPPFIAKLQRLKILDLKACHNLETLPNDISSMKSLTHLILSQCYLLEGMPKGIQKLTQLQVLKGFVIGRKTHCRVSDLVNLKNLKRFSIKIRSEAVIKDGEFQSLGELLALEHLKITWGVSDPRYSDIQISLPSTLKKLHLEGFPGQKIPEWLKPSKLPERPELLELPHATCQWLMPTKPPQGFIELNITGGKLESMNHDEFVNKWAMEMVRLKYLKHLKVELTNLQELFPWLSYAEIKQISNHSYIEWSIH